MKKDRFDVKPLILKNCPDCGGYVDFNWNHKIGRYGRLYEIVWAECNACGRMSRKTVVGRFSMTNKKNYVKVMKSWNNEKPERRTCGK